VGDSVFKSVNAQNFAADDCILYTNHCASGKDLCRCPWIPVSEVHPCINCKNYIHSFCFGSFIEGGKSQCARCVIPNKICDHSMSMKPAGCPPRIVVYDNSSQSLEEVDTSPDEVGFNIEVIDSRVEEQANPSHNELTLSNEQEQVVEANISVNGIIKEQQEQLAWNELSIHQLRNEPDEVGFNIEVIDSRVEEQANPSHNELTLSNEQEQVVEANISVNGIIKEQQEQLAWNELSIDQLRSECRKRKIKNVRQNSRKETLIRYLKEFEKAVHHP